MSLFSRITGVLDSLQKIELDEQERYGAGGEDEVELILRRGGWRYVRNPLAPHPTKPSVFLEGDFLVHSGNALIVLEVKKLAGRVSFEDEAHQTIRQVEEGRYGEGLFLKRFANPLRKTNNFAHRLRQYLGSLDERFASVRIDAAVVFGPTADISEIHDPESIIYTMDLPDLLRRKGELGTGGRRRWVVEALTYVPTWDRVETLSGESIYGLFTAGTLEFRDASGKNHALPFKDIADVRLERGGFLADASAATIKMLRGNVVKVRVAQGEVALDRFGTIQKHKLRNLGRVVPGVARVRYRDAPTQTIDPRGSKMRAMPAETSGRG